MPPKLAPWQLAQAGTPRCGSPLTAINSPRARMSLLTVGNAGAREWRPQRGKMFGHLLEVGVGQKIQQIVHRRIFAAPVPERDQLIVEVACRLSRQPRKIHVAGPLTLRAVAGGAGEHARGHRVGRLRRRSALAPSPSESTIEASRQNIGQNSMRHRDGPISTTRWNLRTSHQRRQRSSAPGAASLAHGSS